MVSYKWQRLTWFDDQGLRHLTLDILWKLKVPSKIKSFGWKAFHGIILLMASLASMHIPCSGQCHVCSQGLEDLSHLMFTYLRAQEVRRSLGLLHVIGLALVDISGAIVFEL
jgi:hypothetical protein